MLGLMLIREPWLEELPSDCLRSICIAAFSLNFDSENTGICKECIDCTFKIIQKNILTNIDRQTHKQTNTQGENIITSLKRVIIMGWQGYSQNTGILGRGQITYFDILLMLQFHLKNLYYMMYLRWIILEHVTLLLLTYSACIVYGSR